MQRLNFTLDETTVELLNRLSDTYFQGNKSQTVRSALESLAAHAGHEGWVVAGYSPVVLEGDAQCHTCGDSHHSGEVLLRPVFERGDGPGALARIPAEHWLACHDCVEQSGSTE